MIISSSTYKYHEWKRTFVIFPRTIRTIEKIKGTKHVIVRRVCLCTLDKRMTVHQGVVHGVEYRLPVKCIRQNPVNIRGLVKNKAL